MTRGSSTAGGGRMRGAWSWKRTAVRGRRLLTLRFGRGQSACALDDFRSDRRPLAPAEVANLAAMFDSRQEMQPLPAVEMEVHYNGLLGRVDVRLFPLLAEYAKARSALVTVDAARCGGGRPAGSALRPERRHPRPRRDSAVGVHRVRREGRGPRRRRQPLGTSSVAFERRQPPWWHNRIGTSDKVMPDWTPVTVQGRTASVVLRDIHFSDAGLPQRIVSAGEDILAGPIGLSASSGGKPLALEPVPGAFQAELRGEVRADFHGRSAGPDLAADVDGYVEFDGMTVVPRSRCGPRRAGRASISSCSAIPYEEESSRLMHWWSGNDVVSQPACPCTSGPRRTGQGAVFRSTDKTQVELFPGMRGSFMPYMMLTGDRRGMAWFAENDRGWTQSTETPAVLLQRNDKGVCLVLNVISERIELTGPRTIEFGLHPIPVKRLESGWRMTPNWGVLPDSFCGFNLKGPRATQFFRHPDNMDWETAARRFRGELGGQSAAGRDAAFARSFHRQYGRDPRPREELPAGLYYDLWRIDGFPDHTREWGELWGPRRYAPDMIDYCVWIWDQWLEHGLAKGIYFDDCYNDPLASELASVTYTLPDGRTQPGFQWRSDARVSQADAADVLRSRPGAAPVHAHHAYLLYSVPFVLRHGVGRRGLLSGERRETRFPRQLAARSPAVHELREMGTHHHVARLVCRQRRQLAQVPHGCLAAPPGLHRRPAGARPGMDGRRHRRQLRNRQSLATAVAAPPRSGHAVRAVLEARRPGRSRPSAICTSAPGSVPECAWWPW